MPERGMSRLRRLCLVAMWLIIGVVGLVGVSTLAAFWWLDTQTVTVHVVDSSGEAVPDATVIWLAVRYVYPSPRAFKAAMARAERLNRSQVGYLLAGPPTPG